MSLKEKGTGVKMWVKGGMPTAPGKATDKDRAKGAAVRSGKSSGGGKKK